MQDSVSTGEENIDLFKNRGARQLTVDEVSYLPNGQTDLLIILHALSLLF